MPAPAAAAASLLGPPAGLAIIIIGAKRSAGNGGKLLASFSVFDDGLIKTSEMSVTFFKHRLNSMRLRRDSHCFRRRSTP